MVAAMGVRPSVLTAPAPVPMLTRAPAHRLGIAVLQVISVGRLRIIAAVVVRVDLGHVPEEAPSSQVRKYNSVYSSK